MTRPCAHVREAKLVQKFADIARMKVHPEALGDDPLEVDPPPAHDPVLLTIRADLDDPGKLSQLLFREAGLGAIGPAADEPIRTQVVEAMDPVARRLPVHAADLRRRSPVHPVPSRGQRQKPTALVDVLRASG